MSRTTRTPTTRVVLDDAGRPQLIVCEDHFFSSMQHTITVQKFCRRLVKSSRFDMFWLFAITLNAIFMGVQLELMVSGSQEHWSNKYGEAFFTWAFVFELLIRVVGTGATSFFCGVERSWAFLDLIIVSASVFDFFLSVLVTDSSPETFSPAAFRVLRMLRVLRIGKVIRGIRFLRDLRLLIQGMADSVQAVSSTLVALVFIMYLGSVLIMSIVAEDVIEGKEYYQMYWSSIGTSVLTLFQVMSGDGWASSVVDGIKEDYASLQLFFVAYYSFTAYGLLNIVTGIFVEQTMTASKKDAEVMLEKSDHDKEALRRFLRDVFHVMDMDCDGKVGIDDFNLIMSKKEVQFGLETLDMKVDDAHNLFRLLDTEGDGEIDIDEFVDGCTKANGHPKNADLIEQGARARKLSKMILREIADINACIRGHLYRSLLEDYRPQSSRCLNGVAEDYRPHSPGTSGCLNGVAEGAPTRSLQSDEFKATPARTQSSMMEVVELRQSL